VVVVVMVMVVVVSTVVCESCRTSDDDIPRRG